MKMIVKITRAIWDRIYSTCVSLWDCGIGNIIAEKRWLKGLLDLTLIAAMTLALVMVPYAYVVFALGTGMILSVLSRVAALPKDSYSKDIFGPFISVGLYALTLFMFYTVLEVAVVAAVFVIPCVTHEIEIDFQRHYEAMTPEREL